MLKNDYLFPTSWKSPRDARCLVKYNDTGIKIAVRWAFHSVIMQQRAAGWRWEWDLSHISPSQESGLLGNTWTHFVFTHSEYSCVSIYPRLVSQQQNIRVAVGLMSASAAFVFSAGEKMDLISDLSALCQMWPRQSALNLFPPPTVSTVTWHYGILPKYRNTKWIWNKTNK